MWSGVHTRRKRTREKIAVGTGRDRATATHTVCPPCFLLYLIQRCARILVEARVLVTAVTDCNGS